MSLMRGVVLGIMTASTLFADVHELSLHRLDEMVRDRGDKKPGSLKMEYVHIATAATSMMGAGGSSLMAITKDVSRSNRIVALCLTSVLALDATLHLYLLSKRNDSSTKKVE